MKVFHGLIIRTITWLEKYLDKNYNLFNVDLYNLLRGIMAEEKKDKSLYASERENSWNKISDDERILAETYCRDYIGFLSKAKTERIAFDIALNMAKEKNFINIDDVSDSEKSVKPGARYYRSIGGKTLMLTVVGRRPFQDGLRIVGGHIDSPRLDAKPNPLYEDSDLALLDTHYYGGIKKYQWVTIPLSIYGMVVKQDGTKVAINIGDNAGDPVFVISDILPHLGYEQAKKTMSEGITGEGLNVLLGSIPLKDSSLKNKTKENILKILNEKYGIVEEDLNSAEIEIVPSGDARELGLDRSMIIGYGQDDRICAYAALKSILEISGIPEYTTVVLLCDKEEIGSVGQTGMDSFFFENSIAEIIYKTGDYSDITVRRALQNSKMLSADVNSLHDPNFPDVSAPNSNMSVLGGGVVLEKYTGSRGKSGGSDASAEFVAEIRSLFNKNGVCWQIGEIGKVDAGGGGTIALFMARYGMDVLDCGTGLLNMHSPWEVASKIDTYMTYKAYKVFLGVQ